MSGQENRGSDKNRTRTLWVMSVLAAMLATLSVSLGLDLAADGWSAVLGVFLVVMGWIAVAAHLLNVRRDGRRDKAAVAVLVVGLVATIGGYTAASVTTPQPRCPQIANPDGGFGTAVTYHELEYVLTAVDTNPPASGDGASRAPLGEWFVVHGTVTNIDDKEQRFLNFGASLIVCGNTYSPDEALSAQPTELNPGLTADLALVYDVPAGFPFGDPVIVRIGPRFAGPPVYVLWEQP